MLSIMSIILGPAIYNTNVIKNEKGAWTQQMEKTTYLHLQSNFFEVLFQNSQLFSLYTLWCGFISLCHCYRGFISHYGGSSLSFSKTSACLCLLMKYENSCNISSIKLFMRILEAWTLHTCFPLLISSWYTYLYLFSRNYWTKTLFTRWYTF